MEITSRYSKKREAILHLLRSTDVHPSAEWVYQSLKPVFPDLSLGTVYRNLNFFREQGFIRSVATVNGQERFDGKLTPHAHLICRVCGQVTDLPDASDIQALQHAICQNYHFTVETHDLIFRGVCQNCTHAEVKINEPKTN